MIDTAKQHLANELGLFEDEITFVKQGEVEWPDTSLGMPEPGMMYPQVITPGFFVCLEARGKQNCYHGSSTSAPRLASKCVGKHDTVI